MTDRNLENLPIRSGKGGVILSVSLMPKASHDEVRAVEETQDGFVLKARVRALPDKGKANKALIILLSDWLGIAKSTISISSGSRSRLKSVHFSGYEEEILEVMIEKISQLEA